MSESIGGSDTPTAHNAAEGAGASKTRDSGSTYGVARNANELRNLTCDGNAIAGVAKAAVASIVVVQEINVPAMCQIVFDIGERWAQEDFDKFKPGAKLELPSEGAKDALLAPMYVSGMTLDASAGRVMLTVTAFDKMHFLRFGAYTTPFAKKSDAAIFEWVANSVTGLTLSVSELRAEPYPYVLQDNETRYDFLLRRCKQANYECMIETQGGKEMLIVRSNHQGGSTFMTLAYKKDVEAINLDMRVPTLGSTVTSLGYNVSSGETDAGSCSSDSRRDKAMGNQTGFDVASPFGSSPITLRRPDLNDASSLDYVSAAERAHHQHAFIEGTATLRGVNLQARAGINIRLVGTSTSFDGPYYVVKSTHRFDRNNDVTALDLKRSAM
ncbi:phage late control D family protein [Trinickia acidisoli]|uniref:phage late control D family protein n=1 Tax=Trinickia acidisoli TaxID=2767482 RepID=UPI001A8EDC3F|nr:contractile injection system protein, VgrG/Pvc8 family [Trinickia acidisoli]